MGVVPERVTAEIEGDFVLFLIGMRINKIWRPDKWLPVFLAMPRMLKELEAKGSELGFLGAFRPASPSFNIGVPSPRSKPMRAIRARRTGRPGPRSTGGCAGAAATSASGTRPI